MQICYCILVPLRFAFRFCVLFNGILGRRLSNAFQVNNCRSRRRARRRVPPVFDRNWLQDHVREFWVEHLIDGREVLVHHAHDLVPRHKSAALPCGQLAFGELFEQVKRALRKLAQRPALARRIFRLFRHLLQIFG